MPQYFPVIVVLIILFTVMLLFQVFRIMEIRRRLRTKKRLPADTDGQITRKEEYLQITRIQVSGSVYAIFDDERRELSVCDDSRYYRERVVYEDITGCEIFEDGRSLNVDNITGADKAAGIIKRYKPGTIGSEGYSPNSLELRMQTQMSTKPEVIVNALAGVKPGGSREAELAALLELYDFTRGIIEKYFKEQNVEI